MFAYVRDDTVLDIEKRSDIENYYHPDVLKDYIPCPETVKIGDKYENGEFIPQEVEE